jgi:REP element-mobilizing transposase RayT
MKTERRRGKPPRLQRIFQTYDAPLYFLTFCTRDRQPILATDSVHDAFRSYANNGQERYGVAVGRYVIMPDHVHLFVRLPQSMRVGVWMRGLKRALTNAIVPQKGEGNIWQSSFFDHLIRHSESYSEKWAYVHENPVRAGLVEKADDWPYQGECVHVRW